jgi:hypothetical protein
LKRLGFSAALIMCACQRERVADGEPQGAAKS